MTLDALHKRIEAGKSVDFEYVGDGASGLIKLWTRGEAIVLTWEEAPSGRVFDESAYTRDERREFSSVEDALDYLDSQGVDLSQWLQETVGPVGG